MTTKPRQASNMRTHEFAHPFQIVARLLGGVVIAFLCMAPLRILAEELPGSNIPQKVLRFVPTAAVGATLPEAASTIRNVATPPNRIVVELENSGTADGIIEVSSGQPLCLGEVSGCKAAIGQAPDSLWKVAITGRQAGVKQMVELANCRSANDSVTPSLFNRNRHDEFLRRKSEGPVGLLFLGDSITDWWPKNGKDTWEKFAPYKSANFGIAAMRTEGLLWNITNGELDGIDPKQVVILIGVNNLLQCPDEKPEWVVAGIRKIVETVREKLPQSEILLLGILPARKPANHPVRARLAEVNRQLPALADGKTVRFLDIGKLFLAPDGTIRNDLMPDGVHPNAKGYQLWFEAMSPVLLSKAEPPRPKLPIMGWSSWNHFRIHIDETMIREQADAMISSGMTKAGYRFVNIDDGYFGGRDAQGKLLCHELKFPSGMKSLADYIRSKGLKPGIYGEGGANTCGSIWDNDARGVGVGLFGHEEQDLRQLLVEWGYDFIKVDWCGGQQQKLSEQEQYTKISGIIRRIKPTAVFNVCRWQYPGDWVKDIADSWRISQDIEPTFDAIMKIVDICEPLWVHCHPGHFNDMDMLQVGRGMTPDEDKTHFTLWCMMNSPLLAGNDLRKMSPETIAILTNPEIIALNQDPLACQARRLRDDGDSELWAKPLGKPDSGDIAVTLLNRSTQPATISFKLEEVGIAATTGYAVRDLWRKETLSLSSREQSQSFTVPPHGVVVLRIKGKTVPNAPFTTNHQQIKP